MTPPYGRPVNPPVWRGTIRRFVAVALVLLAAWLPARSVHAVGTPAGTDITNQAIATYTIDAAEFTQASNVTTTTVAELLDVTVVWQDAASVTVGPGETARALTFKVTNTGNGTDDYTLTGLSTLGGDDFDPLPAGLFFDTNGNGVYDPGVDEQYSPGVNDPTLEADASVTVFVVNDSPDSGLSDADLGDSRLPATSRSGTGEPGTDVPGAGEGGVDAVVGTSGGRGDDIGTYVVSAVGISVVKSASVRDPFGGTEPVPGAVITYSIAVTASGSGTALGVVITDPIPADTTYNPGTLTLNAGPLTDEADADAGDVGQTEPDTVTVALGDLSAALPAQTITFDVTIN